jgi:radical SAM superfamily enzyme
MVADFLEHTSAEIAVQRISGDAPPNFLVEPMWCLDKNSTIKELEEEFRRRSTTQGYAYTHDR